MEVEIPYCPHEKQVGFHVSKAKYRLICTGVGFGKTAAGVNELIKVAWNSPPGCIYVVATPTYRMLERVTFPEFFKFCPPSIIANFNKSDQTITLTNGVQIVGVAGDIAKHIDKIRGMTIAGGYGDEIAMCPEYLHQILMARLRDHRGAMRIWYTTTPRGFNWLYRVFVEKKNTKGKLLKNPDAYEIFGGSTYDNPFTPQEYKDNMEDMYAGVFSKQELHGDFVGYEGLVYPHFSREHVLTSEECVSKGIKDWIVGVDFGFTNPSVALLIGFDDDKRAYIIDEIYEKRLLTDQFISLVKGWKEKYKYYGTPMIYADPSEPAIITEFVRGGLRMVRAKNEIIKGLDTVSGYLNPGGDNKLKLFISEKCKNTIHEFRQYRYPDEQEDKPVRDAPLKVDDHAMDALRYALYTHTKTLQRRPIIR